MEWGSTPCCCISTYTESCSEGQLHVVGSATRPQTTGCYARSGEITANGHGTWRNEQHMLYYYDNPCQDNPESQCMYAAQHGWCQADDRYDDMLSLCPATCGLCASGGLWLIGPAQPSGYEGSLSLCKQSVSQFTLAPPQTGFSCYDGTDWQPDEAMRVDFGTGSAEAQSTVTRRVLPEYTCHVRKQDPSLPLTYDDLDHPDCDNHHLCKSDQTLTQECRPSAQDSKDESLTTTLFDDIVYDIYVFVLLVIAIISFVKYWRSEKVIISIGVKPAAGKGTPGSTNPFSGKSPFCEYWCST
jgi:hypothetical protein